MTTSRGKPATQNLTLRLDRELVRRARVLAAERETSVSGLVATTIRQLVLDADAYRAAKERALAHLERGYHLGGGPTPKRDELHERR